MGDLISAKDLARALSQTPRAVHLRAQKEAWPFLAQGREKKYFKAALPAELSAILSVESAQTESTTDNGNVFTQAREKDRQTAFVRAGVIAAYKASGLPVASFVQAFNAGLIAGPWTNQGLRGLTEKTFYRWLKEYRQDGAVALVPKWSVGGRNAGPGSRTLTDFEKDYVRGLYLDPSKKSIQHCWRSLVHNVGSQVSYSAVLRYLSSLDQTSVIFHREGRTKFRDTAMPFVERDPSAYAPMEQVQSDHHHFDFFINYQGRLIRPWVTIQVDYATGKILSWVPSIYPNSATVAMSFVKMVLEFGAPEFEHTDNGKDYLSKALKGGLPEDLAPDANEEAQSQALCQGLYELCGTKLILATPFNGRSKGRAERWFGMAAEYFAREFPTYCGSNTVARPESARLLHRSIGKMPKRVVEGLDFQVYCQALDEFIRTWNATWRGQAKGREGITPDEAFFSRPSKAHPVEASLLEASFGTPCIRTVRQCQITIDGTTFYSRDLAPWFGKKVQARRLWHRPDEVVVTDLEGRLLTRAHSGLFTETEDLRVVMERKGIETRILTDRAHALKPRDVDTRPAFLRLAAGHEHQALPNPDVAPIPGPTLTTLISPLDGAKPLED